jgi:hypothetical protein
MREKHLGFHASIVIVLTVEIAENLESQVAGAMCGSDPAYAEIIFH